MAKAALNMLTRTSSDDLAKKSRIFMNSVDTGWINDGMFRVLLRMVLRTALSCSQLTTPPIYTVPKFALVENPLEKASKIAKTNLFQTPIDEVDAAARILDPVFVGINLDRESHDEKPMKDYGMFFKDYKESEW